MLRQTAVCPRKKQAFCLQYTIMFVDVRFDVLTASVMKSNICWGIMTCSPLKVPDGSEELVSTWCLLHAAFLPSLLLCPEDEGTMSS